MEDEGPSAEVKEVETAIRGKVIDGWKVEDSIGTGASGLALWCRNGSVKAVMKVAVSEAAVTSLEWESLVMDRIIARQNLEDRTVHLVRKIGNGTTDLTVGDRTISLAYIIMECLPGNPIPIIGNLQGESQTLKIIEYGLQLLKAIYDMHQIGLIHRDIKPENIGMYEDKLVVMYDMGMARLFLDNDGRHRPPRGHTGMRGTEEWSSLNAEIGRDQGRVDDLWGWLYCLNEWVNCRSQKPQLWSAYEREPNIRQLMKSTFFPARMVLNNCPYAFYRISWYLRTLGRDDTPDYFYLATVLKEAGGRVKKTQKPEIVDYAKALSEITIFERELF